MLCGLTLLPKSHFKTSRQMRPRQRQLRCRFIEHSIRDIRDEYGLKGGPSAGDRWSELPERNPAADFISRAEERPGVRGRSPIHSMPS